MDKRIKNGCLMFLMAMAVFGLTMEVFASPIVVRARTDKYKYNSEETIKVILEVENSLTKSITSNLPPTSTSSNPWHGNLKDGNLTYELYRNNFDDNSTDYDSEADFVGKGYLVPFMTGDVDYYGKQREYNRIEIKPNSTAVVGWGDPFGRLSISSYAPERKAGNYVMTIRFSGKKDSSEIEGYATVTFEIE